MTVILRPAHRTPTFGVLGTLRRCFFAKLGEQRERLDDLVNQFPLQPAAADLVAQPYSPICSSVPRWRAPRKAVKNMPAPTAT
jgi:hypothetical protein